MTPFDEFPLEQNLRSEAEQQRFALDIARSSFAVDCFDDVIFNFTKGTVMLIRHGELVGEVQESLMSNLGGVA